MATAALKQEVMEYLDKMDERNLGRVLVYAKSLSAPPKSPYGKFKTAEEYAEAQKLWEEFEELREELAETRDPIPDDADLIKEVREARWRKYESLT